MKLVRTKYARRFAAARAMGITLDDIEQQAWFYLVRAANSFDFHHPSGASFATYATWAIGASLTAALEKVNRVSSEPRNILSIDAEFDGDNVLHKYIGREDPDSRFAEHGELSPTLAAAFKRLSPRQRFVIERRRGLNGEAESLREIGSQIGISKERVRQIEVRAIERLRQFAREAGITREALSA